MLRDDGVSYGDYLEQITYLIFLKMAFEYSQPPYNRDVGIPEEYNWQSLTDRTGAELEKSLSRFVARFKYAQRLAWSNLCQGAKQNPRPCQIYPVWWR